MRLKTPEKNEKIDKAASFLQNATKGKAKTVPRVP